MLLTVDEKSVPCGLIDSLSVTVTPSVLSVDRTMSAMPLPYSLPSSSTAAFLTLRTLARYCAAAGPWLLSVPTERCQNFHPFLPRLGFVADMVMLGRPACSKMGSAALDSPEKAGPSIAISELLEIAFWASAGACAGSPCESKSTSVTLQLGLAASNWLMASFMPSRSLMPSAAALPVRAPKNPMVALHLLLAAAALELEPLLELLQAAMIVAPTANSTTARP